MREIEFAHFAGQFSEQRLAIGIAIDQCRGFTTLQAMPTIGDFFRHRAVDDLRTPCRLLKVDSFRELTRAYTGQNSRQD